MSDAFILLTTEQIYRQRKRARQHHIAWPFFWNRWL